MNIKLNELNNLIAAYQELRTKYHKLPTEEKTKNLFLVHPEFFFAFDDLKKLNVLNLIYRGKICRHNYFHYPEKVF